MNAPINLPVPAEPVGVGRHDGWTADRRRLFLESLAEGHAVESACAHAGMGKVSAYALRRRDPVFALAWSAAALRARDALADILMSRAVSGQVEIFTREDGVEVRRHRHDNWLGLALLTRLDRLAAQPETSKLGQPGEAAARGVAQDFDAFLDLMGDGTVTPDAVDRFVDNRIRSLRTLCGWRREDDLSRNPEPVEEAPVWYDDRAREYRTNLPSPAGFQGYEAGSFGEDGYERGLSSAERVIVERRNRNSYAELRARGERRRIEWFGPEVASRTRAGKVPDGQNDV